MSKISLKDHAVMATLTIRLALADPECKLHADAENAMKEVVELSPDDLYENMNPLVDQFYQAVRFIEVTRAGFGG